MLDYIRTFRSRVVTAREINSLDDSVLADLGLSRVGLRELSLTPQPIMDRLTAMARRHQVDRPTLSGDPQIMSALVKSCAGCRETRECSRFLADPAAQGEQATFCPNFAEFRRLSPTMEHPPAD